MIDFHDEKARVSIKGRGYAVCYNEEVGGEFPVCAFTIKGVLIWSGRWAEKAGLFEITWGLSSDKELLSLGFELISAFEKALPKKSTELAGSHPKAQEALAHMIRDDKIRYVAKMDGPSEILKFNIRKNGDLICSMVGGSTIAWKYKTFLTLHPSYNLTVSEDTIYSIKTGLQVYKNDKPFAVVSKFFDTPVEEINSFLCGFVDFLNKKT